MWSSEGERIVNAAKIILEDPSVTEINEKGIYTDTFVLPEQMHMNKEEKGPGRNGVFEGLTFADNYKTLFVNVEEPLYNDGSRAGLNDSAGIIRIIKYDVATKKPLAQYAYQIDPVAYPPVPAGAFIINGVADILSVDKNKLIVIERSFSTGRAACTIKIYLADLASAENIENETSLKNKPVKMISKKLLLNMDDLGIYIDNIEGVCFGPVLQNGQKHFSLFLIIILFPFRKLNSSYLKLNKAKNQTHKTAPYLFIGWLWAAVSCGWPSLGAGSFESGCSSRGGRCNSLLP